jgi:ribosome biogenesis GTPase A
LSEVGHDLTPCTSTVKEFPIHHHGREVVLLDTPGFNHPTKADGDVLKGIVDWLKNEYVTVLYPNSNILSFVFYLNSTSDVPKTFSLVVLFICMISPKSGNLQEESE